MTFCCTRNKHDIAASKGPNVAVISFKNEKVFISEEAEVIFRAEHRIMCQDCMYIKKVSCQGVWESGSHLTLIKLKINGVGLGVIFVSDFAVCIRSTYNARKLHT